MAKTVNYKSKLIKGVIAVALAIGITVSPSLLSDNSYASENNQT